MSELAADFKGLVTAPGLLMRSRASWTVTQNALFPTPGLIQKRKGFARQAFQTGGPVFKLLTSRLTGDNAIIHYGTSLGGGELLQYGDGSAAPTNLTTVDSGNVTRPLDVKMQLALQQHNHYVTADEGIRRIESDIGTGLVRYAGMPRGMAPAQSAVWFAGNVLTGGTLLPDGWARSYRVTWHRLDADDTPLGGAPTARVAVRNQTGTSGYASATSDVNIVIPLPQEFGTTATPLTTAYYWKLWGSQIWNGAAGETGSDTLYLVAQNNVTAGDLVLGYATYVDATPDTFLVASPTLNTNQSEFPPGEQGLLQGTPNADDPPPLANTVAQWQDVVWAGDISYRPRLALWLIANMVDGDTFDVDGVLLTARLAPGATTDFQILAAGGGVTTEMAIEATARNLTECINYNSTTIYAYYTSPPGTFGNIYLEQRQPSSPSLQVYSSASFLPPITSATSLNPDVQTNVLAWSKPLKGDSFPPVNVLSLGPADNQVVCIIPFRDRLVCLTTYGIYQVTGRSFVDFSVSPMDLTYRIISRDSVVACDDRVYAWCYEGIVEIDPAGNVQVISTPIEPTIAEARARTADSTFAALAFSTAYRTKHRVLFWYPEADNLAELRGCGLWLVFDTRTRCWSDGVFHRVDDVYAYFDNRSTATVRYSDDNIIAGNWNDGSFDSWLFLERHSGTSADYTDTTSSGVDWTVPLVCQGQFTVPASSGAVHWQQTVVQWDGNEQFTGRTYPTSYFVQWTTEAGTGNYSGTGYAPVTRAEPPLAVRRGHQLQVLLSNDAAEYAGLVGLTQCYSSPTEFAK